MTEEITFESTDGLTLEGAWDAPENPRGAVVFCHPHPKMGGTMNAPLLVAVTEGLVGAGWGVVRFNFRGIGSSEGEPSTGIDEVQDARGAIEEARRRHGEGPPVLAGWSFGAAVAVRTADEVDDVAACVAIAPAVNEKAGITAGLPPVDDVSLDLPVLFVAAANDDLVSNEDGERWVGSLGHGDFVEMPGANHFFWAKYEDLTTTIVEWLDQKTGDGGMT